ncbi:MAG: hypothetical protein Fur0023_14310 [Bacteroidia bacterium]
MNKQQLVRELLIAARQTKRTPQKAEHYFSTGKIVLDVCEEICSKNYSPGTYTCFVVTDPTPREILAPAYKDRIVHRWLVNKLEPFTDKRLLSCSYANRKNKGHHKAVKQLQKYLGNYDYRYFLKADIQSFFNRIYHDTLVKIVHRWIEHYTTYDEKEKDILKYIAEKIIRHNPTQKVVFTGNSALRQKVPPHKSYFNNPPGVGLPLGNLTSQFFANLYLNELDRFVKFHLKAKYYLRYVDDFVILGKSAEELYAYKKQIEHFLSDYLHLTLHPQKQQINLTRSGIDFCGYVVWARSIIVRKRVIKTFRKKLNFYKYLLCPHPEWKFQITGNSYLEKLYRKGALDIPVKNNSDLRRMECSIHSYLGIINYFTAGHPHLVRDG